MKTLKQLQGACDCCGYETTVQPAGRFKFCHYCMNTNLSLTVTEPRLNGQFHLLASAIGWIANEQRALIIDLLKPAGVGRPKRKIAIEKVRQLRAAGLQWPEVAKQIGVPQTTLRYALREADRQDRIQQRAGRA